MQITFVGECDDGLSVSSHHALVLRPIGCQVTFDPAGENLVGPGIDAVHLVTTGQTDDRLLCNVLAARAAGISVLRFWTGPDLVWARFHEPTQSVSQAWSRAGVVQYCRTREAQSQLAAINIAAEIAPLISTNVSSTIEPHPLPQQFTALCNLSDDRRAYCGGSLIDDLVRWMPRIRFLILGESGGRHADCRNVEWLGAESDVRRAIQRSTVAIVAKLDRSPARLMIESLALGRHVVSNCPWPNCQYAETIDQFMAALRALQRDVTFNLIGREEVCQSSDRSIVAHQLCELFDRTRASRGFATAVRTAWQASIAVGEGGGAGLRNFPPPDISRLPPEAEPLRALLQSGLESKAAASA